MYLERYRMAPKERMAARIKALRERRGLTQEELADKAGTINYELACGFGMRLERLYR